MMFPSAGLAIVLLLALPSVLSSPTCPNGCICLLTTEGDGFSLMKCQTADHIAAVGPIAVDRVDLSNAAIIRLTNQLENLQNLTHLDLSNNRLSEVSRVNKKIHVLNLSYNRITSGKLGKIPLRIRTLNLTHNEITYLPLTLMRLKDLKQVELAGNRINCTCETLQVRNWLQDRHVWTDQPVKCHSPIRFKGRPWLQVRQADVCDDDKEKNIWGDAMDNELMMGDAPVSSGDAIGDDDDYDDDIEHDYLPYGKGSSQKNDEDGSGDDAVPLKSDTTEKQTEAINALPVEGSGVGIHMSVNKASEGPEETIEDDDDYDEGEDGSGSGFISLPPVIPAHDGIIDMDNGFEPTDNELLYPLPTPDEEVTRAPLPDLGIFGGHQVPPEDESTPVNEIIIPVKVTDVESLPPSKEESFPGSDKEEIISPRPGIPVVSPDVRAQENPDKAEENKATFILLVVLGLALVALIAFIVVKRRKRRSRRNRADAENPRGEEMQTMDKKQLLGKPVQKNGNHESAPLMPNREKSDFAKPVNGDKVDTSAPISPYQRPPSPKKVDEAVQKRESARNSTHEPTSATAPPSEDNPRRSLYENDGSGPSLNNNDTAARDHNGPTDEQLTNGYDHTPTHLQNGEPAEVHQKPTAAPKSPALARYSPVYSPETGRVKIKLTETPKPKTPLLVTRSRSNAGDIITTPYTSPIRGQQS
ncbi:hypothetical protein DMENIID0001_125250 [Sergentomyia squamirostris]